MGPRSRFALAGIVAGISFGAALFACGSFSSSSDGALADAGAAAQVDGASSDAASDASVGEAGATLSCPGKHGSHMVLVAGVCVDANEATFDDYASFLADTTPHSFYPTQCAYKKGTPGDASTGGGCTTPPGASPPNTEAGAPVVCVDWCDAWSFCDWAGKHLCGEFPDGGTLGLPDYADAAASEWLRACSSDGTSDTPTGTEACNVSSRGLGHTWNVTGPQTVRTCEGPSGVFDMIGNANEWVAACDGGACALSNGSFGTPASASGEYDCRATATHTLGTRQTDIGFRCCAAPEAK